MRAVFATAVLCASLTGAWAIEKPPARYDHAPTVRVVVVEGTPEEVNRLCRKASRYHGGYEILSCALPSDRLCIIVWPKGNSRSGLLWRHERAHCNGWVH